MSIQETGGFSCMKRSYLILILLICIASAVPTYASGMNYDRTMASVENQLDKYHRGDAYEALLLLLESMDKEKEPGKYMDVLSRVVALEAHYWLLESVVAHAIELYQLGEANNTPAAMIQGLGVLAAVDYHNYQNASALRRYSEIISITTQTGERSFLPDYYFGMAKLSADQGDFDSAHKLLQEAILVMDESSRYNLVRTDRLYLLNRLSSFIYYMEGDYESGLLKAQEAAKFLDEADTENRLEINMDIVDFALLIHDLDTAEDAIRYINASYLAMNKYYMNVISPVSIQYRRADFAFAQGYYEIAATLYQAISMGTFDVGSNVSFTAAMDTLESFDNRQIEEQFSLYKQLQESQERIIRQYQIGLVAAAVFTITVILSLVLIVRQRNILHTLSVTDQLTQIHNRRMIINTFEKASNDELCIALIDLDHFKGINDRYGHVFGDEVLKKVANTIRLSIRNGDMVGRYGGEEFMIMFDQTTIDEAKTIIERILRNIEDLEWGSKDLKTTASAGLVYSQKIKGDDLIREADELLYASKHNGRNQMTYKVL